MLARMRDYIKTKPRLYDLAKRSYRFVGRRRDVVYEFLDRYSRQRAERVDFVQIGAGDGLRCDPIREFVVRDRWRGILVEPLPHVFDELRENYRYLGAEALVFVNAAISDSEDSLPFWTFVDAFLAPLSLEERLDYLRKSSFDKRHVERVATAGGHGPEVLKTISIKCMSYQQLLDKHWIGRAVDLLVIDAEGHEPTIIEHIDYERSRPEAILFESHNLGNRREPLIAFLETHGYRIIDLGGDSAAVSR